MSKIKIHVLECGFVHTTRYLPYNKEGANLLKVSGIGVPESDWVWMPVFTYLIEHPEAKILVDTGWSRRMSPTGTEDKKTLIRELGYMLYRLNQGYTPAGKCVDEQLRELGLATSDLDYVILTHLDCDHACGLHQVADARHILVSAEELRFACCRSPKNMVRYQKRWWKEVPLGTFPWSGHEGPFGKSYDLLGDGSVQLINIPGHSDGLGAVKITNPEGKYVLLDADGAYGRRSWEQMILPGISDNKSDQLKSLQWIREMSLSDRCIESLATHDTGVKPHTIEF